MDQQCLRVEQLQGCEGGSTDLDKNVTDVPPCIVLFVEEETVVEEFVNDLDALSLDPA